MIEMKPSLLRCCIGLIFVSVLILVLSISDDAHAHKPSDSYLKIRGGEPHLRIQWHIAIKDLELVIGVDSNRDGEVTWGELKGRQNEISAHALSHLKFWADGIPCRLQFTQMLFTDHSDGGYAVLDLSTDVVGSPRKLKIEYSFLFDADPTHRGLVLYENDNVAATHVLSPSKAVLEFEPDRATMWSTFVDYVFEGVWHIWIGFDHILFLISLLLPAVLLRKNNRWQPVQSFKPSLQSVLKIVTVFTLAHSITLWLAVMGYVTLPSRLVESTIAFSIIVTTLGNLIAPQKISGWVIAFFFGLIHGFGFANVLLDLGLSSTVLTVSLFGFNVGVELGQLAIVAVFLPIAFFMRNTNLYEVVVLKGGSIAIAIIAAIWMLERVGNFDILGF
jgi:hypothetical protein